MVNPKSFGVQLRKERRRQGKIIEIIAKRCGVSRSFITLIENGKRLPGPKTLPKIALALGLKNYVVVNWYLEDLRVRLTE